jgi:site-specific DNA-cytosine methylase
VRVLDLFTGLGGFSLAAHSLDMSTVAFCDNGGGDPKHGGFCPNVEVNALLGRAVWPTPHANAHTGAGSHGDGGDNLQTVAGGSLNPSWVETLMGYPVGYTMRDSLGVPSATYMRFGGGPQLVLPDRFPAGLGAEQYDWEPPRLTQDKTDRAHRLKALGNSIVPSVARLWLEAIEAQR